MNRLWLIAAFAWLAPALAQTGDSPAQGVLAGRVELVEGDVRFLDRSRRPRQPALDDPIFEGDSIVTGPDGEVHLRLEDGGFIGVRPGTRMRITNFRAQGDEGDRLTIGLLEGTFRSVTGWIAKLSTRPYTVRTPMATIGVRGTDHEPSHIPEGSALGEPGTYDKVNEGGTFLQTERGRVDVAPGRAAFAHLRRAERPRVLDRLPGHFRATRHEARITQRYHEIQRRLPQLREERRKMMEERRARFEQKKEQRKKARELREHKLKKKEARKKRE